MPFPEAVRGRQPRELVVTTAAPVRVASAEKTAIQKVAAHDERYYCSARPEISDQEYDRLKRELVDLESSFPEAAASAGAQTPTARVGDDRADGFRTVRHRQPMQSLDNTYSEAELREFHARLSRLLG